MSNQEWTNSTCGIMLSGDPQKSMASGTQYKKRRSAGISFYILSAAAQPDKCSGRHSGL